MIGEIDKKCRYEMQFYPGNIHLFLSKCIYIFIKFNFL